MCENLLALPSKCGAKKEVNFTHESNFAGGVEDKVIGVETDLDFLMRLSLVGLSRMPE